MSTPRYQIAIACFFVVVGMRTTVSNADIIFIPVEREINGRIVVEEVEALLDASQYLPQLGDEFCLSCPPPFVDIIDPHPDLFDRISVPEGFEPSPEFDPTPSPMLPDNPNIPNLRLTYFGDTVFGPHKLGSIKFDDLPAEIASIAIIGYGYDIKSNEIFPNAERVRFSNSLGDFDNSGLLDLSDLKELSFVVQTGMNTPRFDLNFDQRVDRDDLNHWVTDLRQTHIGDSNLDGAFDSGDLVQIFSAGEYEDGIVGNSTWSTGDWTGDGEFDSADLVAAFQAGGYEQGPLAAANVVPEPTTSIIPLLATVGLLLLKRR